MIVLALAIVGVVVISGLIGNRTPDIARADFRRVVGDLLRRVGTRGMRADLLITQYELETGAGQGAAFKVTNNLGSIHASGPANPYWNGERHKTTRGETLRAYKSLEDAARDHIRLLSEVPRYKTAYARAVAGDADGFFEALAAAGYAADPRYSESLKRLHRARVGVA